MPKRFSTARGRAFGEGVRAAIEQTGMSGREIAERLDWQEAKVSDMVNGKGGVSLFDVLMVLSFCRIPFSERDRLLGLFPDKHLEGWWQLHGKCAPVRPDTALAQVAAAKELISWHTHAVPTLLQTVGYLRALLVASATVPSAQIEQRLLVLQEMHELLRNELDCTFYIHELALDLQVGSPEVQADQLRHLLHMADWTRIKILIVPGAARAHAGMAGPFTQLKFPKYQSLVWTETENSSLFVEQKDEVEGYEAVVRALDVASLDEDGSRDLIVRRCDRLQVASTAHKSVQADPAEPFPPL